MKFKFLKKLSKGLVVLKYVIVFLITFNATANNFAYKKELKKEFNVKTAAETVLTKIDSSKLVLSNSHLNILTKESDALTVSFNTNPAAVSGIVTICQGQSITFTDTSTAVGSNPIYSWSFPGGDVTSSNSAGPQNIKYDTVGNFTAILTINGSSSQVNINVVSAPTSPSLIISNNNINGYTTQIINGITTFSRCGNFTFGAFNFVDPNISSYPVGTTYLVSWGDSTANSTSIASHSYTQLGVYKLTYTVIYSGGCEATTTFNVFVGNVPPTISITGSGSLSCSPNDYEFTIASSSNAPGTVFTVTINDGTPPIVFLNGLPTNPYTFKHKFIASSCGTNSTINNTIYTDSYSIKVTASNACDTQGTFTSIGPIRVSEETKPSFSMSETTACVGSQVSFVDQSNGGININQTGCNYNYGLYWEISPNTGYTVTGNLGSSNGFTETAGMYDWTSWTNGSKNLNAVFTVPGTYTISLTTGNGCGMKTVTQTICITPQVLANFSITPVNLCAATTATVINTSSVSGCSNTNVYSWVVTPTNPLNCPTATNPGWSFINGTNATSFQPEFNFTSPGVYTIQLTTALQNPVAGSLCANNTISKVITIKDVPQTTLLPIALCEAEIIVLNPTVFNCYSGTTTYSWDFGTNPAASIATSTSSTPSIFYSTAGTYPYTLTLSNECGSKLYNGTIVVSQVVQVTASGPSGSCVNNPINLNGTVTGGTTTGVWTASVAGGSFSPNANSLLTTYTPPINFVGSVVLTLTSSDPLGPCPAVFKNFTVTFNAEATATAGIYNPICKDATLQLNGIIGGAASSGSWTSSNGGVFSNPNSTTSTFTPPVGYSGTITLTLTTNDPAGPCNPAIDTTTFTVLTTPIFSPVSNQIVCSNDIIGPIVFSGSADSFRWTNSAPAIGLAASGIGNIGFTATNSSTIPLTATIIVTPYNSSSGVDCPGVSTSFTITVNPSPTVIFSQGNQTICSGSTSSSVNLSSSSTGILFSWSAVQPSGISGMSTLSGIDSIPSETLVNNTNSPITITYLATAQFSGCPGIQYSYSITVNPEPAITGSQTQIICSGDSFSIIPLNGSGNNVPAGTLYTWNTPVISPIGAITNGSAQNSPQATIGQILTNTTDQSATATYTVTPKFASCTGSSFQVVVTVNPVPKVIFSAANQVICSGSTSSIINLSTPTAGTVSYNWTAIIPAGISGAVSSGTNTIPVQTLTNSTANPLTVIYSATATFTNGLSCTGLASIYSITVNPARISSSVLSNYNGFNISAAGANDGAINMTVSGGSGTYTYSWTGPGSFTATSEDISNLIAGTYILTINDGLCSPVVVTVNLVEPLPLLINEDLAAHVDVACNGNASGQIKIEVTQQSVGPYSYILKLQAGGIVGSFNNSAAITHTFSGLVAGIYDASVTDANGVIKNILGIQIGQPSGINAAISTQTNVLCFGSATGSATVTASGGNGILTYSWNSVPVQTTATATGLLSGTYTVSIMDANVCPTTRTVTITQPANISISIASQTNVLCFGGNSGAASVLVSGGVAPYSYSWNTSPVQTLATATGLSAGTYNVTVTDANNCTKVQSVTIIQPAAALSSSITNITNVSCFGANNGSLTVTASNGTAAYSYSWNTIPVQTLATATGLAVGNYTVTVTDANGCVETSAATITEPISISTSISAQTDVSCSGSSTGSATILATGGTGPYMYSWNTTPIQTTATGINLAKGTYLVTVKDANNCSKIQQVTISEPNGIITGIASQTNVSCFGTNTGAATISVSGGTAPLTYSWDTSTVNNTLSASGLVAGTYHLTVTDANSCVKTETVIITQPNDIVLTTDLKNNISCYGAADGKIAISINGGNGTYSISWTKDGLPFSIIEDLVDLASGLYQVTVKDSFNCVPKTLSFTITEPAVLDLTLVNKTDILCYGFATGAVNVAVVGGTIPVGGYHFAWTSPNSFTSTSQNLTSILAGTYTLIVTDDSGCTDALTVLISQPSEIVVAVVTTPIICYGANNASINLSISGGISPYQVTWPNFLATGTFQDNLSAGNYNIVITDASGCTKILDVNIPQPPIFDINPVVKQISCFGANDGSINLNIVGGLAPLVLKWSDNPTAGNVRNNLKPGSYTVTITDSKPCVITRTFVIIEPFSLLLSANVTDALNCNNANSGAINLMVSGGTPPFSYTWSNGATTEDLTNAVAGNYLVTVTDSRGCSKSAQYAINRPSPIVLAVNTKINVDCPSQSVSQTFTATAIGGVPPYVFNWSTGTVSGANNQIMNTNQSGLIQLSVTDAVGCSKNYSLDLKLPAVGDTSFSTSSFAYATYGSYSIQDPIQFTNLSTGDYQSLVWDFGDGTISTEVNPLHTYVKERSYVITQKVTYSFGCVYTKVITLVIDKGYKLMIPDGFTPNNDAINESFKPVYIGLNTIQLDVYDTWGELIYSEKGDVLKGWNGIVKGVKSENGNYFYKIQAITFYGITINESGPFVLIK